MKKVLAISLLMFYTSLSVVSYVSLHFCHGQLKSVSIFEKEHNHNNCHDNDAEHCNSCCTDIAVNINFEPDQENTVRSNRIVPVQYIHVLFQLKNNNFELEHEYSDNVELPPPLVDTEIYISNCSLTYYG